MIATTLEGPALGRGIFLSAFRAFLDAVCVWCPDCGWRGFPHNSARGFSCPLCGAAALPPRDPTTPSHLLLLPAPRPIRCACGGEARVSHDPSGDEFRLGYDCICAKCGAGEMGGDPAEAIDLFLRLYGPDAHRATETCWGRGPRGETIRLLCATLWDRGDWTPREFALRLPIDDPRPFGRYLHHLSVAAFAKFRPGIWSAEPAIGPEGRLP
jgi:hypothetical protein